MNFGLKVSPDAVGLFTWPLIALLVVRLTKGGDPRQWGFVGIALGFTL